MDGEGWNFFCNRRTLNCNQKIEIIVFKGKNMTNKKTDYYLAGFIFCQIILVSTVFFVQKETNVFNVFIIILLTILITLIGDLCIFGIILSVMAYNEEKLEIQHLMELNQRNYQFYQFAVMQQKNIRFFYHDLSNHLMALEILREQGKEIEMKVYAEKILKQYKKQLPEFKTGNVMLDILIQYYQINKDTFHLIVIGTVPEQFNFEKILSILQSLESVYSGKTLTLQFGNSLRLEVPKVQDIKIQECLKQLRKENSACEIVEVDD